MSYTNKALSILLILVAMASAGLAYRLQYQAQGFDEQTKAKLDAVVENAMQQSKTPGMVVGVWTDQGEWIAVKGKADLASERAMQVNDKFRIGSITKTFVSTIILQLADEGKLSLDDTLSKYQPQVPNGGNITIRQLLNHSSGLYAYTDDPKLAEKVVTEPLTRWTPKQLLDIGIAHEPYFPPGQAVHYSNTNYLLQGMIVEQITGNTIEQEVQRRIIDRLGLMGSSFPTTPGMPLEYARGYIVGASGEPLFDYTLQDPSWSWAAGAMIGTLDDLKVWARSLAEGDLLSSEMQKERLTLLDFPMNSSIAVGYGLGIASMDGYLGHNGALPGYMSEMFYSPSSRTTIVVLVNEFSEESGKPLEESFPNDIVINIARIVDPGSFPSPGGPIAFFSQAGDRGPHRVLRNLQWVRRYAGEPGGPRRPLSRNTLPGWD